MFVIVAKNAHIAGPVGSIVNWIGIAASDGVIPCDGRWLTINGHLPLFLAIGYEYTTERDIDQYRDDEGLCLDRMGWLRDDMFQVPDMQEGRVHVVTVGDSITYWS